LEEDDTRQLETAEDSTLDTPAEERFLSSESFQSSGTSAQEGKKRRKKPELVAVKLAHFMGQDLSELFAGINVSSVGGGSQTIKDKRLPEDANAMAITSSPPVL